MHATVHKIYRVFVSAFVAVVLIAQTVVTFSPVIGESFGFRLWPVITYAMYTRARYEGDSVEVYELLEGTLQDGSVVDISMDTLGLGLWQYRNLVRNLKEDDPVAIEILTQRYRWGTELAEIRIMSFPVMVTKEGPAEMPSELLHRLTLKKRSAEES